MDDNKKEKREYIVRWFGFIFFGGMFVVSLMYNSESWVTFAHGAFTLFFLPIKSFQKQIHQFTEKITNLAGIVFAWIIGIAILGLIIWGSYKVLGSTVSLFTPKYDGMTAEEWADESAYWEERYSSFRSCVEDYDSFDIKTQIDYGGVFYYCE